MFFRKGRGLSKPAPAHVSSMPTCACQETLFRRLWGMRHRLVVITVLIAVGIVVIEADPVPWDVVLPVLISLALRS